MTELERECLDLSVRLWEKLLTLPVEHQNDQAEFSKDLHAVQNRVAARPTYRAMKEEAYDRLHGKKVGE